MTLPNDPTPPSNRDSQRDAEPVCNILIVDDEPSNLLALEAILEPLGQRIIRAGSGVEALRHALTTEFCVVILDVQMPEMDGIETAALLRRRPRTRDVPVIFLTAISKDEAYVARGYETGAVDYIFKPADPDALRTKVATFVELARKNAHIRAQHEALRVGSQRELAAFKKWSERRYEDLANSMPQIVWTADASGKITYRNRRWAKIASSEELDFSAIVHPEDLESFSAGWATAVRGGGGWDAELRIGNPEAGYRYHLVRAVPRRDDHDDVITWVGTATDIDARVRADRALRMLADASHQLNLPLLSDGREVTDDPSSMATLETVLAKSLPILGQAAILDLQAREVRSTVEPLPSGVRAVEHSRLSATVPGIDPAALSDPRFDLGPATVGYTGRAEVFLDIGREQPPRSAPGDAAVSSHGRGMEHLRFLQELNVSAYICVPLVSRDRTIGTLTFAKFERGGRYELSDVDLAGDLARRIAVAVDNARLHATTERRREELEVVNRSKDVFLATLSHELRTPLNAIVGWTDMMKKGALQGDDLDRAMETIDRNAHALSGLVADLLDVSRIVTGTLKIESKAVSLASVVEAGVLAARPLYAAKNVALEVDIQDRGSVLGDAGRLRQVLTNLLNNAVKFTPKGGTVSVRVERETDRLRLVVSDTGEGITADFLPHVFERFRQAETGRAKGLGLGLAIVKHLVEEHGGTVGVHSDGLGRGASFTVDLPFAIGAALPTDDGEAASSSDLGEPDLSGVHILIVEDDPDGNELVCAILERYGARVTSATTAAGALEVLDEAGDASERPQILVSDIGLPDMDGMELIKRVRGRDDDGAIPAVALTAYASRQDATKAISAGFDAHVAKPVQPAMLGSVVLRLLAREAPRAGADRPSSAA